MRRLICFAALMMIPGLVGAFSRSPLPDNAETEVLYPSGTRVLIIGMTQYRYPVWPSLSGDRDAERIRRLFLDRGVSPAAITVSLPKVGTKASLEEIIVRFGEALASNGPPPRVVVYIAGHGYTADGIGYLVPPDAPDPVRAPEPFKLAALPITTLLARAAAFKATDILLIIDACFSGLALQSLPQQRFAHPTTIRSNSQRVLQVITAGSAGQTVGDDGRFSELVVSGLTGAADLNFDGWISGTELGMYLRLRMTEISAGRQTPAFGNIEGIGRDFVEGENWFASAQLPLQVRAQAVAGQDARSQSFRDCDDCPLLRVVPSARSKSGGYLALGVHEVTFREYDACFRTGHCVHWAWSADSPRAEYPVTDVSRADAEQYTHWLTCLTGNRYRLPNDSEWMAAASLEPSGPPHAAGEAWANCRGCGTGTGRGTLPVGSLAPNDFGLYDLVGNVWEWVADCAQNTSSPCRQGWVRGGAFSTRRAVAISLPRGEVPVDRRDRNIGFRVARELEGAPIAGALCQ